ncbi:MAG: metal-dependent hydrolase [Patescibacteria group bacterium]
MDILYHAVSGIAITKSFGSNDMVPTAIAATLPDILGILPFYALKLREAIVYPQATFIKTYTRLLLSNKFTNNTDATFYRNTHSLVGAGIFTALMYFLFPERWVIFSFAYLSHILIDIPTHEGQFATRLLYPFSAAHIDGANWSTNPKLFLSFWLGLLLVMLFL